MSELKERIAYLQGLAEGMELEDNSKEGKLIAEMLDLLGDVVDEIHELSDEQEDLIDYVEELDDDLTELEDDFYEEDEEDEDYCCCDDEDYCECDEDYVEVTCPQCQEVVCFDKEILDAEDLIEVVCPVCDAVVFVNDGKGIPANEEEAEKE